jgi:ribosomal protein L37AE/L43A
VELFTTRMNNGREVHFCPQCIFRVVSRKGEICRTCIEVIANRAIRSKQVDDGLYALGKIAAIATILAAGVLFYWLS